MSYCTVADLRLNIAGLTADNTKAPESYLTDLIARKSALINSYVCNSYVTPVDMTASPESFAILKDICITICKPPIADRLKVATPKRLDEKGNQFPVHEGLAKAMKMLESIKEGVHKLPDAVPCADCDLFDGGSYNACDVDGIPSDAPTDLITRRRW